MVKNVIWKVDAAEEAVKMKAESARFGKGYSTSRVRVWFMEEKENNHGFQQHYRRCFCRNIIALFLQWNL